MERTIDRTSYRRSARQDIRSGEKLTEAEVSKTNKKFRFTNMILNQTIVSLLMMIGILSAKYFEMTDVIDWVAKNMSNGYEPIEIVSKIKNSFLKNESNLFLKLTSGEMMSGEVLRNFVMDYSGEQFVSGEAINSGELISAVEGINQMIEDSNFIKNNYDFYLPLKGIITSNFGSRESDNPIVSSYHAGLDIAADTGTDIHAAHSGKVILAKMYSSYGNCIMIEDGDLVTVYAHCSSINVEEGQEINRGDVIAKVGMTGNATGPHLHFEIRYQERFVDPSKVLDI